MNKAAIRQAADEFSEQWATASSEQSDRQPFWDAFYGVFGLSRRHVAVYEQAAQRASTGGHGWIDMLQPGEMAVEHKSRGENLDAAMEQLEDYLAHLKPADMPWLLVACDFGHFKWGNLETGEAGQFALDELVDNLDLFWWLAGGDTPQQAGIPEIDANLQATELLAELHDELKNSGYPQRDMREWLTRILFCLFADDAEIWDRKLFENHIETQTAIDGSDLGSQINYVFQIINTPFDRRSLNLPESMNGFAYVNGDLFHRDLKTPSCNEAVRDALRRASRYNWSKVSPAIFGSLFQNVMEPAERRRLGAHYTTEENILRTIRPLFLDNLEAELENAKTQRTIQAFHDKMAELTFFDPACGCGNFLVVSYREIRRLETEAIRKSAALRGETPGQRAFSLDLLCKVTVDQFYGIEIEEFPALIARTALYLADHLANLAISAEFGEHYARFPIPAAPHIAIDNALRVDWNTVLPAGEADYVFGNPPFSGHALVGRDSRMVDDRSVAFAGISSKAQRVGRLDYVSAWYAKAIPYMLEGSSEVAFVSTNSIVQGEQARTMGPVLEQNEVEITFAHQTFAWTSEAKGTARVHVVIIGVAPKDRARSLKPLFEYPDPHGEPQLRSVRRVNWYLTDGPLVYPGKHTRPLTKCVPPPPLQGSKPVDAGCLLVTPDDYDEVSSDPIASLYLRPYKQAREMLYGTERWCLWLESADPAHIRSSPTLAQRTKAVQESRLKSRTKAFRDAAATPSLFAQRRQPSSNYLAFPEVSSEHRRYIPAAYLDAEVVAGNKLLTLVDAPLWVFGVLQSSMWMTWVRAIVGRLESRFSLAPDIAYSAFPWPELNSRRRDRIESAAQQVLDIRAARASNTLAELYDPLAMPNDLVLAHNRLDQAVDAAYGRHRHTGDGTRLAVLLRRYVELTGGDPTLFDGP